MKVALDLKEISEICAKHLQAKGHKLAGRYNLSVQRDKVLLIFDTEEG